MKKQSAPELAHALTPGLRRYLYLTAAVAGAAVLIVEILGAKMLAPYLGTSHFVWTAQIAVTLVSLAVGYYFGGWLVDRAPRLTRLYACLLVAAVYLTLTIPFCSTVAYACLRFRLALGALVAAMFLFFVPLTLLATVGPFLIRVMATSLGGVGGQAGRLSAISTAGSVLGTVAIGYLLIPWLPNSYSMFATAAMLMVVAGVYFLAWGRKAHQTPGAVLGIVVGCVCGLSGVAWESAAGFSDVEELVRVNSNFGQLQVLQTKDGQSRFYLNDYLVQNTYDPTERKSTSLFTYMLHDLARGYTPRLESALCIGMGMGIVPMQLAREGVRVDVVEINPAVVPVARQYFGFEPERVNLLLGDGRQMLQGARAASYDTVILDAFLGDSSPSHLMTQEAFAAVRRVLAPGGTLVINSFGDLAAGHDFLTASLDRTLRSVFKQVRVYSAGRGNVYFVASDREPLENRLKPDPEAVHWSKRREAELVWGAGERQVEAQRGRVLTDDFNPAEFHDAANREEMRRQFALAARRL